VWDEGGAVPGDSDFDAVVTGGVGAGGVEPLEGSPVFGPKRGRDPDKCCGLCAAGIGEELAEV
jgi:hypothetical protein